MTTEQTKTYWDPASGTVSSAQFADDTARLKREFVAYREKFRKNPEGRQRRFTIAMAVAVAVNMVVLVFMMWYEPAAAPQIVLLVLFGTVVALIALKGTNAVLETDAVKYALAHAQGWLYSPYEPNQRMKQLVTTFGKLFNRGTSRSVDDELWGSVEVQGAAVPFWLCDFTYTTGSGKTRETHDVSVVAIRLPRQIHTAFYLAAPTRDPIAQALTLSSGDIKLESTDFNGRFEVYVNDKKVGASQEVLQILTPAVQQRLIELDKKYLGEVRVFFDRDVAFFMVPRMFGAAHTDFNVKPEIDQRDIEGIKQQIVDFVTLAGDIARFLD